MLEILDSMTADEVRAIREDESRPEFFILIAIGFHPVQHVY
jgi:hypothetical protein